MSKIAGTVRCALCERAMLENCKGGLWCPDCFAFFVLPVREPRSAALVERNEDDILELRRKAKGPNLVVWGAFGLLTLSGLAVLSVSFVLQPGFARLLGLTAFVLMFGTLWFWLAREELGTIRAERTATGVRISEHPRAFGNAKELASNGAGELFVQCLASPSRRRIPVYDLVVRLPDGGRRALISGVNDAPTLALVGARIADWTGLVFARSPRGNEPVVAL